MNKAMHKALRLLSYPSDIDLDKTYKLQRAADVVKTPLAPLAPIYRLFDRRVKYNGRFVRVRTYREKGVPKDARLILFFHGGGWVHETVDTYNRVCRAFSRLTGSRVASVEYSRAPEYIFPQAVEECYAVAEEIFTHPVRYNVKHKDITLIGDSAGGNLAAAVSLMARDRGEFEVLNQVLIYPATYNDHSEKSPFPSVKENGEDYLLTSKRVEEYMNCYAGGKSEYLCSPYFAPLLARDKTNQPRTLVITCEYDPLRDEGEEYAKQLKEAGNDVRLVRMPGMLHGYIALSSRFKPVKCTFEIINDFLNKKSESCSEEIDLNSRILKEPDERNL